MKKFLLQYSSYNPNLTKKQVLKIADTYVTKRLKWTDYLAYVLSFSGLIFSLIPSSDTFKLCFSTALQIYLVISTLSIFQMFIAAAVNYLKSPDIVIGTSEDLEKYRRRLTQFFDYYDMQRVCKTVIKNITFIFIISFIIQGNIAVGKFLVILLILIFLTYTWLHFTKLQTFWNYTIALILTFLIGFAPAIYFLLNTGIGEDWIFRIYALSLFVVCLFFFSVRKSKIWAQS